MLDDPLTEKIIGCAYKVYNTLGAGFLEAVYKRALIIELSRTELPFAMEAPIKVLYGDKIVGSYYADIIVNDSIIVEIKAVDNIVKVHEVQLVNYLHATGIPIGLLINFGSREIGIKRKYRDRQPDKVPDRIIGLTE